MFLFYTYPSKNKKVLDKVKGVLKLSQDPQFSKKYLLIWDITI